MNFGEALHELKAGRKVGRNGWDERGIFIQIQFPDKDSKMTSPYIFIDTTGLNTTDNEETIKSLVPWMITQEDVFAEDWIDVG